MTEFSVLYGGSLYALAEQEAVTEQVLADLELVASAFDAHPDYVTLLDTPTVTVAEKLALLEAAFGKHVHPYTSNFLKILAEKRQLHSFAAVRRSFITKYNADRGIEEAVAITAVPLSEKLTVKLTEKLSAMTGKKIVLKNKVDPSILGGFTVRLGNKQIDASMLSRLQALEAQIKMNS